MRGVSRSVDDNKPLVLTTFTILADMARNVSGDLIRVRSITKLGAEIHGYQPTPSDLVKASGADLIIENGLGLELWAQKYVAAAGNIPKVILSDGINPLMIEGDAYAGKPNPHVWMSPSKAIDYVDKLVEAFIILYPEGRNTFLKNGSKYKQKLHALDAELRSSLSSIPKERRILVTCEGAFSYLAKDYGMDEAYLWPVNAESQVTPRRMLNLIKTVKARQVPAIFCESTVSSKAQREVAKASGSSFGGIFYVDSLSEESGPAPTLLELMRHNVSLIVDGLTVRGELENATKPIDDL
ncbi:metal ABC transporter substrate-binding protein [Prochlorococcus sp. MIT 1341]|uniref:metal ABC transporter substrate-binding protein n=1 Tax=Prochlorococcus sp. MIT 1341 TaxID=3096221 RepID=UPI002A749942|nr:metal ABC transporter substrate-binding protein [Prochlorococcus sp. MIT 1341]